MTKPIAGDPIYRQRAFDADVMSTPRLVSKGHIGVGARIEMRSRAKNVLFPLKYPAMHQSLAIIDIAASTGTYL
jgi:hypothetical protein